MSLLLNALPKKAAARRRIWGSRLLSKLLAVLGRWNEDFELLLHDPEHEMLKCVLMNKSSFGADEEIGRVEVYSHP